MLIPQIERPEPITLNGRFISPIGTVAAGIAADRFVAALIRNGSREIDAFPHPVFQAADRRPDRDSGR